MLAKSIAINGLFAIDLYVFDRGSVAVLFIWLHLFPRMRDHLSEGEQYRRNVDFSGTAITRNLPGNC
jgi:hypothetical protein